jgi:hypothetical protein
VEKKRKTEKRERNEMNKTRQEKEKRKRNERKKERGKRKEREGTVVRANVRYRIQDTLTNKLLPEEIDS